MTYDAWMQHGLCVDGDPEWWMSDHPGDQRRAAAVCRDCPVRQRCLDYAREIRAIHGIFGGLADGGRRPLGVTRSPCVEDGCDVITTGRRCMEHAIAQRERDGAGPEHEQIMAEVAADHGLDVGALKGRSRKSRPTVARWDAMLRLHESGLSTLKIGALLDRDHSTVIHGIRRAREVCV